ncbi:MAG: YeeE/YedE family protein [Hyphomicrobiaceae bacterium]
MVWLAEVVETLRDAHGTETLVLTSAAVIGIMFGIIAEASRFCLRSAIIEGVDYRAEPTRTARAPIQMVQFLVAIAVALAGTQALVAAGSLDLSTSIQHSSALNVAAVVFGGVAFGIGMMLSGGCLSRLVVLSATGNLRAMVTLLVAGITAHATISGVLTGPRLFVEGLGPSFQVATVDGALGITALLAAALVVAGVLLVVAPLARRAGPWPALVGAGVGGLVVAAWVATGIVGHDDFSPTPVRALVFAAPLGESVRYLMISTGDTLKFGTVVLAGILAGSFLSALVGGRLALRGFDSERAMLRYLAGGVLMGFGGVVALGCSFGQGVSGISTLSIGSFIALAAIVAGGASAHAIATKGLQWGRGRDLSAEQPSAQVST